MIEVKNLTKEFIVNNKPFKAVDDVSFHVDKGEVFGIIGLSGAGKSTLVRCLNRLEDATSGEIIVDGININELSKSELLKARRDIGMIFQNFNLFYQSTVYENIAYPLQIINAPKEEIKETVEKLLEFIDLKDKKNSYPSEISGGQKQRVAIARALSTKPKVLLSDESTSALDPANTSVILNLLRKSVQEFGMTVIMITHQMEVAKSICDRIAVMENGKIIECDTVENIFRYPKTKRTKSFIQSLPDTFGEEKIDPKDFEGTLLRLTFSDENSKEPILSKVMKDSKCDISIISGQLNRISNEEVVGYLIIEVDGSEKDKDEVLSKLREQDVNVEVL